ncbi:hypothetical protein MXD63_11480, partial [Frankia sp. Cpl3]|nr:hypothetical protein [Frankia sp. Cpl3]
NPSDAYVRTVLTWLGGYRQGGATPQAGTGAGTGTTSQDADDPLTIVPLTPTGQTPGTGEPGATPVPAPGAAPSLAPVPELTPDPDGCDPLRPADLGVVLTDLDPAAPGAEALDLTTSRLPWRATTVTVEATAATTGNQKITTSWTTLQAGDGTAVPALLARIPGASLAAATLPEDAVLVTLTISPADSHCPAQLRVRISNVPSRAFAATPTDLTPISPVPLTPAPTTPAGTPPPSTTPPGTTPPSTTPPATTPPATVPPRTTPPTTPTTTPPPATTPPGSPTTPSTAPSSQPPASTAPPHTTPAASSTQTSSPTSSASASSTSTPAGATPSGTSTATPTPAGGA